MELKFINNNKIPERETSFGGDLRDVCEEGLPFWYNNPWPPGQSSHSGIIIWLDSHCGIIILPIWYLILPFWYLNDVQRFENKQVTVSHAYFMYIRTQKTRVRARETCKRKKVGRSRIARRGSKRFARVVGHRHPEAPILVF